MSILGIILLSVSLSIDALGIGVSYGLRKIRISICPKIIICSISILFTAIAILIGNVLVTFIPYNISKIIGCVMLLILGAFIIFQALFKNEETKKPKQQKVFSFGLKTFGITIKIIRDPVSCDFDKSMHIDTFEAIYLGTALSIDSFGAGICSSITGMNSFFIPIAVGLCQLLFLCIGNFFGSKLACLKNIDSKIFIVCSGIIMISLAFVRYFFS